MSRKPVYLLERELEFARRRAAFYARTDRPTKPTVDRRPRQKVGYASPCLSKGGSTPVVQISASKDSITWFGINNLGLYVPTDTAYADGIPKPKALKPAMVKAVVGTATPVVQTARASGRRYARYTANTAGNAQAHYSVPISKKETLVTAQEQENQSRTVFMAVQNKLTANYSRFYYIPERFTNSYK